MDNKLARLIELAQKIPESRLDEAIKFLEEKIEESKKEEESQPCPYCKSENVKPRKSIFRLSEKRNQVIRVNQTVKHDVRKRTLVFRKFLVVPKMIENNFANNI